MLKFIYITIILLFAFSNCGYTQNNTNNDFKKQNMEKFNIKKFEENNPYLTIKTEIRNNGDKVIYDTNSIGYYMYVCPKNSPFKYYSEFDKQGNLKLKTTLYYDCLIKRYDYNPSSSTPISSIDFDSDFKFSINDLEKLIKEKYNVDISNTNENIVVNLYRYKEYKEIKNPFYQASLNIPNDADHILEILVDGNNGTILYSERHENERTELNFKKSLIEQYIDDIKKELSENNKKGFWSSLLD